MKIKQDHVPNLTHKPPHALPIQHTQHVQHIPATRAEKALNVAHLDHCVRFPNKKTLQYQTLLSILRVYYIILLLSAI